MTKRKSAVGDNNGLCESCNDPKTEHQVQRAYSIQLGGGLGWGTLWLCPACAKKRERADLR